MKAAGNGGEQCEVFGNAVFGHQVACGGLVAGKQSHAEFFRNGIPGRGAAPSLDRSVGKTENRSTSCMVPGSSTTLSNRKRRPSVGKPALRTRPMEKSRAELKEFGKAAPEDADQDDC